MQNDHLTSDAVYEEDSEAKSRLKTKALELFSERGFINVSVRDLMNACGLTAGALYAHYPSKEELLFSLVREGRQRLQARLAALFQLSGVPSQRLARLVYVHTLFQLKNLQLARVASSEFRYLPDEMRADLGKIARKLNAYFDETLAQGVEAGLFNISSPLATRMAILSGGNFAPQWFEPKGKVSAEAIAAWHAEMALRVVMATGAAAIGVNSIVTSALQVMEGGWDSLLAKVRSQKESG
jgi:AcrR family transcriptional regulator